MTLSAGTRLGPYEILSAIGAGGMGEVYRAKDTRLDRIVAIKVLASHLSDNPDLKQRFEREARTISSLSHSHICALHDVGHQDGIDFLVMEYLEGETLAARLQKGALTTELVLRHGIEIADALDKAHRQGVVHRDLKPGNIMLTKSGVKLLDFGLAKLRKSTEQELSRASSLETEDRDLTAEGTILGTLQYMSPEQLEGKETDGRTDIFAFGTVLYEMVTGKKAFEGKSQASLIAAILKEEPRPISTLQPMSPPTLERVVRKCLAKDPDERWQSAGDLKSELQWIAESGSQAGMTTAESIQRKSRDRWAWILAALFGIAFTAALLYALLLLREKQLVAGPIQFTVASPEGGGVFGDFALSLDGRSIVFTSWDIDGTSSIWLRPLDSLEARKLAGTEGGYAPFWAPDSRTIGFFAGGKLKKLSLAGGSPQILCDAFGVFGGTWSKEGVIVFASGVSGPLYRVSAAGGIATPLTKVSKEQGEESHRWPQFLPDGKHVLYTIYSSKTSALYVDSVEKNQHSLVLAGLSQAVYAGPGNLLFIRDGTLVAQPFDAKSLQMKGEAIPLAQKVAGNVGWMGAALSVSTTGVLAYQSSAILADQTELILFDRSGGKLGTVGKGYRDPSFSPDDKKIAVFASKGENGIGDLWVIEPSRNTTSRFTFTDRFILTPIWSPDGNRIVFSVGDANPAAVEMFGYQGIKAGYYQIFGKELSGTMGEQLLLKTDSPSIADDWSTDGKFIAFEQYEREMAKRDLWLLPMSGERKPIRYLQTPFDEFQAQFSPDGKWMAYVSDESGRWEVYVQAIPVAASGKWQISNNGGVQPRWHRDGKELFYLSSDQKIMAVDVNTNSSFEVGIPKPLFAARILANGIGTDEFIPTADGQRFLIASAEHEIGKPTPIVIVLNWTTLLKK